MVGLVKGSAEQQQKLDSRPQVIAAASKNIVSLLKEKLRCSETELQEELTNDSFTEPISVADWLKKYERTALLVVCLKQVGFVIRSEVRETSRTHSKTSRTHLKTSRTHTQKQTECTWKNGPLALYLDEELTASGLLM